MEKASKNPSPEEICDLINSCTEKMKRYIAYKDNRRLAGLTLNQIEILHYVGGSASGTKLKDLIQKFRISKSLASQSVGRLVSHGYLKKSRSDSDARNILLFRTKKLARLCYKIKRLEKEYIYPLIQRIPNKELETLSKTLKCLSENFNRELA